MIKIGIDIDGVLANTREPFLDYCSKYEGFMEEDQRAEAFLEKWHEFALTPEFKEIQPMPYSKEVVAQLVYEGTELYAVTHRHVRYMDETVRWLQTHYNPNSFKDIWMSPHNVEINKSVPCRDFGIHLLIDDNERIVKEAKDADEGLDVIKHNNWYQTERLLTYKGYLF